MLNMLIKSNLLPAPWGFTNAYILVYLLTYAPKNLGKWMCMETLCLNGLPLINYFLVTSHATFAIYL